MTVLTRSAASTRGTTRRCNSPRQGDSSWDWPGHAAVVRTIEVCLALTTAMVAASSVIARVHVGSMFLATSLAVGPSLLLYLIASSGNVDVIYRAFGRTRSVFGAGGALYGLALLRGFLAALNSQLDLTASWLITAYVLAGVQIVFSMGFERWTTRIDRAVDDPSGASDLDAAGREHRSWPSPEWSC